MSAQTIAEAWEQRAAESALAPKAPPAVQERRAFYAGALQVLLLRSKGASESALLDECRLFGRAIGTAAEAAR